MPPRRPARQHQLPPRPAGVAICALATALMLASTAATAAAGTPEPVATQITATNAAQVVLRGPKASGGIGDWFLSNGTLCAVINDAGRESELSTGGGALIDLDFCDRGDDQFVLLQDLLNADRKTPFPVTAIEAAVEEGSAAVVVSGSVAGLNYSKRYVLSREQPDTLAMVTRIRREQEGDALMLLGSVALVTKTLAQYDLALDPELPGQGFSHREGAPGLFAVTEEVSRGDWLVLLGEHAPDDGVAFGLHHHRAQVRHADGSVSDLPHFYRPGVNAGASITFSTPFWFGDRGSLGYLDLLQSAIADLEVGEEMLLEEHIRVAPAAAVAALTDRLFANEPRVTGRLDWPGGAVHILDAAGRPVTQVRADEQGLFRLRLPPGDYQLEVRPRWREPVRRAFTVAAADLELPALNVGPFARLTLPHGQAMRLTIRPGPGTPPVDLADRGLDYGVSRADGSRWPVRESSDVFLAGVPGDPTELLLPAGTYDIFASRGPEYSITRTTVELAANRHQALAIDAPAPLIRSRGWLAADLHVHSAPSFDTAIGVQDRIRSYVAQGGDVLVSTEHETIYDFSGDIAALGLGDSLRTIAGTEITTEVPTPAVPWTSGHANAFPLRPQPLQHARGAPANEGLRWREITARILQQTGTQPVFQLNHARPIPTATAEPDNQQFFSHLGVVGKAFDRYLSLHAMPNAVLIERDPTSGRRDIDFDAIEILNTSMGDTADENLGAYQALRDDWFSLLRQGVRMTATANSDSHSNSRDDIVLGGRNLVRIAAGDIRQFSEQAFVEAVRAGRLVGTTGPLLEVNFEGAGPGDTITGGSGRLAIAVLPSPWWDRLQCRVFIDGVPAFEEPVPVGTTHYHVLQLQRDAFIAVEVHGPANEVYAATLPHLEPLAFSNPIYVDADGDGKWHAPGTPLPRP